MNSRWRRRRQLNPRSHVLSMQTRHALLIAIVLLGDTATVCAKEAGGHSGNTAAPIVAPAGQCYRAGIRLFPSVAKTRALLQASVGAVLSQGRVLVTADLVANQNYVELERAESGEKIAASVEVVDYEANLASSNRQDKKFLDGLAPLELATDTIVGDKLPLSSSNRPEPVVETEGLVTAVQVMRYPLKSVTILTYRLSIALQYPTIVTPCPG